LAVSIATGLLPWPDVTELASRLVALLIGVNAGPLITPWASLATLPWHQRLTSLGVQIRWSRYFLLGLVVAPVTVVLATLFLSVVVGY
jgi:arsenical pump membrane protein